MVTFNPRARGGDGLKSELAARRRREEQLGRQRVTIPPGVSPTPGGVEGVTRCVPTEFGSYFDATWGTLYANYNQWTVSALSGKAPPVTIASVGDPSNGLDSLVVAEAGWYSFRLQFYVTFNTGAAQPSSVYAGVVPPRGDAHYDPVEATFPVMSGSIPGVMPDVSGAKRSTGVVPTDALLLAAGDVVALHVSWDAAQTLWPNADGRPRCLVDVTKYL